MAGKNIVVCLDGTGNQFRQHNTNVVKLYRVLLRDPAVQVAYYDPGVGTLADPEYRTPFAKRMDKALGLAFGRGLTRNIEEAYAYLMEQHQTGDRIYLFGFSRGAYTARALAGFIHACGLLERGCQNLIPYAMKLYRAGKKIDFGTLAKFRKTYGRAGDVKIHLLGLWDTVSTFGWVYDPIALPFTNNNSSVERVRHALAVDERRVFFPPKFWGRKHECDLKEVWFAGVHADVGGGYSEEESGLAKIALKWMIDEAAGFDLLTDPENLEKYVCGTLDGQPYKDYVGPCHEAKLHNSLTLPWWPVEFIPQRVWDPQLGRKRWRLPLPPARRRCIDGEATLHQTVLDRMGACDYAPPNLLPPDEMPGDYTIENP